MPVQFEVLTEVNLKYHGQRDVTPVSSIFWVKMETIGSF
jgi:hypothetical protein